MKRLLLSIVGGLVLPFLYSIITGPLSLYIGNEGINYLLWIPIGWPNLLSFFFFSPFSENGPGLGVNALFIINTVCNMIFYGSLIYVFLFWRSVRRAKVNTEPPLPPTFC